MRKIKNISKKLVKCLPIALFVGMLAPNVLASGINDSKLVTGTQQLIDDVTTWLMVLAPVVAGVLIIYFCIRRSAADEMDTKKWNNRITAAIVSCVGAVLAAGLLNVLIGYFQEQ